MKNKLYDISQTLRFGIPVWPGDSAFRVEWMRRIAKGGSVNVSTIHLSTHTGTHTDAPYHFSEGGAGIDEVPLGRYLGPAEVVDIAGAPRVEERHLRGLDLTSLERVLFHTLTGDPGDVFPGPFPYLSPDAARPLVDGGVLLVGIDAPSIDPLESKDLPAHHILLERSVAILEGLDLRGVPAGHYELIALPLKLAGLDGSPVRAVLRAV